MLEVPRDFYPSHGMINNLLNQLADHQLYQASVNTQRGPGDITLGLTLLTRRLVNRLEWNLGDAIMAHQLVAADINVLDLFMVDEDAIEERKLLEDNPALLSRMPHHAMQSLVHGVPRVDGYVVYLSETRFHDEREKTITMWGLLHEDDLVDANLGDPLLRPFYYYLTLLHEEIYSLLHGGRYRRPPN